MLVLEESPELSIRKQAKLLGVSRSNLYYNPVINTDGEMANMIYEIYGKSECRYGYRKVHQELLASGYLVNKKKVQRIMKELGIEGLYPKRKYNTTIADSSHKTYPYLLSGLNINRPNQVWATDITYIKLGDKFMYFMAIIDLYSRYVVKCGLNHSLDKEFYISLLSNSLKVGKPEIFNSDQGSQFTSKDFTKLLLDYKVKISMDHAGRCFDNIIVERLWRTIKQEAIYYYKPETVRDLEIVLINFIDWYNNNRRHQSLKYQIPADVYYG